jgi:tripartite-type tricarboxylate transporter receptor subunit TctC
MQGPLIGRLGALAVALAALTAPFAQAQTWPAHPVRIVVGYPPGGGTDLVARLVQQPLADRWKQPVVIENRGGANAIIGTDLVAKARPDGHTLLMAYATELAVNPVTIRSLPYDPVRDFAPIAQLGSAPLVLAVNAGFASRTVAELIAAARAKPGGLSYSSSGSGSVHHFAGELFNLRTGAGLVHVPYKGSGPATADAVAGQVPITFASVASVLRFVQAGRLRALAVSASHRSSQLPDVPTGAEAGLTDYEITSWYGLLAPAGTPREVIGRIAADVGAVLASAEVRKGFEVQGLDIATSSPEAFASFIRAEAARYVRIARAAGIAAD